MKKISLFLIAISSLLSLNSCEDKNEIAAYVQPNYLAGKWVKKEFGILNGQNRVVYTPFPNTANCEENNIIFNEDFTYESNDFTLVNNTCDATTIDGIYNLDSNIITIATTDTDGNQVVMNRTINYLTHNEMTLVFKNSSNQIRFLKLIKG
jgi:hypothetical protein